MNRKEFLISLAEIPLFPAIKQNFIEEFWGEVCSAFGVPYYLINRKTLFESKDFHCVTAKQIMDSTRKVGVGYYWDDQISSRSMKRSYAKSLSFRYMYGKIGE